jgi:methyl-accepting chemotaxis protein
MSNKSSIFSTIRGRLTYGTLALTLLPLLIATSAVAFIAYRSAQSSLQERAQDQLVSLRAAQADAISQYFNNTADNLRVAARNPTVIEAAKNFIAAFDTPSSLPGLDAETSRNSLKPYYTGDFSQEYAKRNAGQKADMLPILNQLSASSLALQSLYVAKNPNPLGSKNKLVSSPDGSVYSSIHVKFQPYADTIVQRYGLYDFFLVDPKTGSVVYTYFKELDFTTSLLNGPYAKTKLAEAFIAARDIKDENFIYLSDYAPYLPSYEDQAAFMSKPIIENGVVVSVLIVQVPIDKVNAAMTYTGKWKNVGLGASGETYLLGSDATPRSVSRFLLEDKAEFLKLIQKTGTSAELAKEIDAKNSNIGLQKLNSSGSKAAIGGQTGFGIYPDYRNISVLGAYQPLNILGQKWALMAEIDESEAFAPVTALLRNVAFAALIVLGLAALIGTFLANRLSSSINKPLAHFNDTVTKIAMGDTHARVKSSDNDELGTLSRSFDNLLDERVASFEKAEKENEQLNNSIIEIMMALGTLSKKDLTIKVPVSEDVTGAVSDGLNLMTSETAKVLREVENVSMQVAQASVNVRNSSESARNVSNQSSIEIESASTELAQAARALIDIARQAKSADGAAEEAIAATRLALSGVRETVTGINSSRDLIRETEKRIKRLGERTQEISTAVNSISAIADRTSILALNTSMQAVAAGEAGRAYAVVADEVKRLAESARAATQQISNLVSAIQSETVDTVDAINRTIGQVVDISRTAERAGEQMQQTETKTGLLVSSVREIARTTEEQSKVSGILQQRAEQLQIGSRSTSKQLEDQSNETMKLVQYAQNLVESVSVFKLPE